MTGIEIILIIIGFAIMIASFMVTEKLSASDLGGIAKMSEAEIKRIVEKQMAGASDQIDSKIDDAIDGSIDKVERALDKETNEKIMAISEYSDSVIDNMNKTHNEIMFLYSMLNDKHTELTDLSNDVTKLMSNIEDQMENVHCEPEKEEQHILAADTEDEVQSIPATEEDSEEKANHNERILELYEKGYSYIDIARELALGLGEVKLVIDLYKGEE